MAEPQTSEETKITLSEEEPKKEEPEKEEPKKKPQPNVPHSTPPVEPS